MTSNYYMYTKCSFFQFFNSPVALKNKKIFCPPRKSWNDAPARRTENTYLCMPYVTSLEPLEGLYLSVADTISVNIQI